MLGRFNNVLDRFSVSRFGGESSIESCVLDEFFAEGLRINEFLRPRSLTRYTGDRSPFTSAMAVSFEGMASLPNTGGDVITVLKTSPPR
jgi:hypothetical protein